MFRSDLYQATHLLLRAVYPNFQIATDLRRRYDPEYMLGELTHTWSRDSRAHARELLIEAETIKEDHRQIHQTQIWMDLLDTYIEEHPLPEGFNAEARRALRIMFHTNRFDLRSMILGQKSERPSKSTEHKPCHIAGCITYAQSHATRYSQKLVALRFYHELTRLEFMDYCHYVQMMIQENPDDSPVLVDSFIEPQLVTAH